MKIYRIFEVYTFLLSVFLNTFDDKICKQWLRLLCLGVLLLAVVMVVITNGGNEHLLLLFCLGVSDSSICVVMVVIVGDGYNGVSK